MRKHSLKIKLTIIMAALVTSIIVIICVLNSTLFEKYYVNNRVKELKNSYDTMAQIYEDNEDNSNSQTILDTIQQINAIHNINICIIDSNWKRVYSSQNDVKDMVRWVQDIMFNQNANQTVLEENNDYTVVRGYDAVTALSYLEIYGSLDDGSQIIMQITMDSIKENVSIFNRFVMFAGVFILVISIVAVYLISYKFTKPVKELSLLATQMSAMNFDVKYSGKDNSEIGLLGHSMNVMSDNLEKKITELKAANLELQKDIEVKTQNDSMRREFLSNVSHELKTPIALIQGYAEGLKEGISDDPESMDFYCEVIMDEANKMNNMVKKLLTLNQIEFGNDPVNIEHFNISELIFSILKSNKIRLEQNEIQLETNIPQEAMVWFDQIQLEEVFTNFISNAINHCEFDKIIKVEVIHKVSTVYVSVFNTGKNIPDEDIDRIWEKFYKVDKARTREYGGNGIGLSIVKAILDNYNASYGVENKPDGVLFWFEIDANNNCC